MRVIAGKYGGRKLKSPANARTRPTSDRLRETLFNVIGPRIASDTRFLDLCAGTGAVGIEALSRGAGFASFVERARKNCALIEENLDLLEIPELQTDVIGLDVEKFLKSKIVVPWDIIFFDPPYSNAYNVVLELIGQKNKTLLAEDGILVTEHRYKTLLPDAKGQLRRWRILRQGETALSFYEKN